MAQLIIEIPNDKVNVIKDAFTAMLQDGDAVDINNPTNEEILVIVKTYLRNSLKKRVDDYEKHIHDSSFNPTDLGTS